MISYEANMLKEYDNILSYLEKQRDRKFNKMKNLDVLYKINRTQYSDDRNNIQVELYYIDGAIEIVKQALNNFRDKINIEEKELSSYRPAIKQLSNGDVITGEVAVATNPYLQRIHEFFVPTTETIRLTSDIFNDARDIF